MPKRQSGNKKNKQMNINDIITITLTLFAVVDIRLGMLLSIYLVVLGVIMLRKIEIGVAYWWYPSINATVGFLLVIGGLLRIAT